MLRVSRILRSDFLRRLFLRRDKQTLNTTIIAKPPTAAPTASPIFAVVESDKGSWPFRGGDTDAVLVVALAATSPVALVVLPDRAEVGTGLSSERGKRALQDFQSVRLNLICRITGGYLLQRR